MGRHRDRAWLGGKEVGQWPTRAGARVMTAGAVILYAFALYGLAGVAFGAAFVTAGVSRVLPHNPTFTPGARLLILPGAAALWPYVLLRWLKARKAP